MSRHVKRQLLNHLIVQQKNESLDTIGHSQKREKMTRPYLCIILLEVILILFIASFSLSVERSYEATKCFPVSTSMRLKLENPSGDLQVHGWDKPLFKYVVNKIGKGETAEEAKGYLDNIKVRVDSSFNDVKIGVDFPNLKGKGRLAAQVDIRIWLPNQSMLDINLDRGSTEVRQVFGKVSITAKNILLLDAGPEANLKSINGDLQFHLSKVYKTIKHVYCFVANSNLEMSLPAEAYRISLAKANGKIYSDFPIIVGFISRFDIKTANGGIGKEKTGRVILEVTNGDISLKRRE